MALSSDAIIKNEIIEAFPSPFRELHLRIFPEGSNDDQKLFKEGGLTFSFDNVDYGSCDAAWYVEKEGKKKPFIGLEGTDALNRNSTGDAQYQRFHHALGAVKNGLIGVYYLKKGKNKIQEDLYGMAVYATKYEKGTYIIIDDLKDLTPILENYDNPTELQVYLDKILKKMTDSFNKKFQKLYKGSWDIFSKKRSTIICEDIIIKYAGRMKRSFTDSSQRAGHIAVGEMYLSKYYFFGKTIIYLMPRMTSKDIEYLNKHKADDKEWYLLCHEPNVILKTRDDIANLGNDIKEKLKSIEDKPLKNDYLKTWNKCKKIIDQGFRDGLLSII